MTIASLLAWGMPGGGELIIIFVIILLLFGAKRLPELARSLGQAKKEFQKATKDATDEVTKLANNDSPNTKSDDRPKQS